MRQLLLVLILALLAVPAVAETPQLATTRIAMPQAATTQAADTQVTLEDLLIPVQTVDPSEACNAPAPETAAAGFCPFGSPTCRVHDDCDDYCGSPEFGFCDKQGFFPTGCCLCLG